MRRVNDFVEFIATNARVRNGLLSEEVDELVRLAIRLESRPLSPTTQALLWKTSLAYGSFDRELRERCADYCRNLVKEMWNRVDCNPIETLGQESRLYASALRGEDIFRLIDKLRDSGERFPSLGSAGCAVASVLSAVESPDVFSELASHAPEGGVLIPSGEFTLGGGRKPDENPAVRRWLPSFFLGKFPVTVGDLRQVAGATDLSCCLAPSVDPNWPAHYLSWSEASNVACLAGGRLPTESEWEKAACGPSATRYPWGEEYCDGRANTLESGIGTFTPVDRYLKVGDSAYGVTDMVGNSWEWTSSTYAPYSGEGLHGSDPRPLSRTSDRVLRGGAYDFDKNGSNCLNRYRSNPARGWDTHGMRMAWGW